MPAALTHRPPEGGHVPSVLGDALQFMHGRSASSPSTNARARRLGSTRVNRPAIRPLGSSNIPNHRSGSTLWPRPLHDRHGLSQTMMITRWPFHIQHRHAA